MAIPLAAPFGEPFWPVLAVFGAVALTVGFLSWSLRRGRTLLARWAAANGFTLVQTEWRWIAKGPYFWRSSNNQMVYRIAVSDAGGTVRRGWARCGGWVWGLLTDQVDVRWDEAPRQPRGFPVVMPRKPETMDARSRDHR